MPKSDVYYRFTENNDWEGETWHFYIPASGNIKKIRHLEMLAKTTTQFSYEMDFERQYSEEEVNILVDNSDSGYMSFHNKVKKIKGRADGKPLTAKDLYKGSVFEVTR